jgi:phosphopantothenoylcysteine decarboxylase
MNPAALSNQTMFPLALQRWADMLLLAPLSANTLAKVINGLSDNLLTDILRIWHAPAHSHNDAMYSSGDNTVLSSASLSAKPILAAVALTNSMYSHPITKRQLVLLKETFPNICILKPVEKCVDVDGNIAMGGMRSWREVVDFVTKGLGEPEEEEDGEDDDTNDDDRSPTSNLISIHHRQSTLSSKEIQEHERLASQNAILNSGVGFDVPTPSSMLSERA